MLTSDQADELRRYIENAELRLGLELLRQYVSRSKDGDDVRSFVSVQLGALRSSERDFNGGTVTREAHRVESQRIAAAILATIEELSAADAAPVEPTVGVAVEADGPAPEKPAALAVETCDALGRDYPGFSLPRVTLPDGVRVGELVGVIGRNASGKTTFLRMLAGDLRPSCGTYKLGRLDTARRPVVTPVEMVPQSPAPWTGTLRHHIQRTAALFGFTDRGDNARMVADVASLLELDEHFDRSWAELSGGYRMRAAIAAALVARPLLLLLDEPLAPLDPSSQQRLLGELVVLAKAGTAIVCSSQHVPEIEFVADLIVEFQAPKAGGTATVSVRRKSQRTAGADRRFALFTDPGDFAALRRSLDELVAAGRIAGFCAFTTYYLVETPAAGLHDLVALMPARIRGVQEVSG